MAKPGMVKRPSKGRGSKGSGFGPKSSRRGWIRASLPDGDVAAGAATAAAAIARDVGQRPARKTKAMSEQGSRDVTKTGNGGTATAPAPAPQSGATSTAPPASSTPATSAAASNAALDSV